MNENLGAKRESDWRHLRRPWRDYQDGARVSDVPVAVLWFTTNAAALGFPRGMLLYKSLRARLRAVGAAARGIMRADSRGFLEKIAAAPAYARTLYEDEITGWRGWLVERDATTLEEWNKWSAENQTSARTLKYLLYSSAVIGIDLSKPYGNRWSKEERESNPAKKRSDDLRRDFYDSTRKSYDALGDEGRRLYTSIRDNFNFQQSQAVYVEDILPSANSFGANKPENIATRQPVPRRLWHALAVLGVLYMGALYLNHQAHACIVLHGYSMYQDGAGYHLCQVRPWYWFW